MAASRNKPSVDLPARVGKFLATHLTGSESLCVGLSGGCDSVVLLHILSQLGSAHSLSAIHVHHGLSPNADRWASFCRDYCARLKIALLVQNVDVELGQGDGLESAARRARYKVFSGMQADCLVLAQHRGDQAETVLFNLLRGAGVVGAAAMPAVRDYAGKPLLRPLLDISRAEIEAYALSHQLTWIEDESNQDISFSRNYLRHEIFPALLERFPAAESSLAQAAANFSEAASLLDELAEQDWCLVQEGEVAQLGLLRQLSTQRFKNLLRYRLRQLGWRMPAASRLDEYVRQLQTAGPDRHPELVLSEGRMYSALGRLHWLVEK
jgi:tRNA(Ile)-lysidine synthase